MSNSTPIWSDRKRIFCGLPWTFTTYTLTSDRLFIETGVLGKHEDEVRLYRILDISLSRSFSQRIFGLGTIHCCSADKTMGDFDIINIKNPREVKERLSELVEESLTGSPFFIPIFHAESIFSSSFGSMYAILFE